MSKFTASLILMYILRQISDTKSGPSAYGFTCCAPVLSVQSLKDIGELQYLPERLQAKSLSLASVPFANYCRPIRSNSSWHSTTGIPLQTYKANCSYTAAVSVAPSCGECLVAT
eukprot:TRINITY_DN92486_c0_g1_i1.p1 TRINITY_DN92486_c0_g1~~TRINITY_DN92486_c0_g1_i1.p1  ORF type:complete len:114 (-),score=2.91 TRINITY_DN92486_c0_g1_i1:210-551(-)